MRQLHCPIGRTSSWSKTDPLRRTISERGCGGARETRHWRFRPGGIALPVDPLQLMPLLAAPFIGSFIATLAIRLPQGAPILWARSACDHCGTTLRPREMVPIVSWAVQRGKCRYCGGPIAGIHPPPQLAAVLPAPWSVLAVPVGLLPPAPG